MLVGSDFLFFVELIHGRMTLRWSSFLSFGMTKISGFPADFQCMAIPKCSMYGIFTYIWVFFTANVGKYSIITWSIWDSWYNVYLKRMGRKTRKLHSDVRTVERFFFFFRMVPLVSQVIRNLRIFHSTKKISGDFVVRDGIWLPRLNPFNGPGIHKEMDQIRGDQISRRLARLPVYQSQIWRLFFVTYPPGHWSCSKYLLVINIVNLLVYPLLSIFLNQHHLRRLGMWRSYWVTLLDVKVSPIF